MRRRLAILLCGILLLGGAFTYFLLHRKATLPPPITPQLSQERLHNSLQDMVAKKAEINGLQTQLAVYEKMLTKFPDSKDLQNRVQVLKQRIRELE